MKESYIIKWVKLATLISSLYVMIIYNYDKASNILAWIMTIYFICKFIIKVTIKRIDKKLKDVKASGDEQ